MKMYFLVVLTHLNLIFVPDVKINLRDFFFKAVWKIGEKNIKNIFIYFTSIITWNNKPLA